jgi:putative metallopeptidase DUF4344
MALRGVRVHAGAAYRGLRAGLLLSLLGLQPLAGTRLPQAAAGEPARIDIAYLPPKNAAHRPLYELLMRSRVLEKMQALLGPFRLPRRVVLKVEGCDGTANAFSGDDAVTVCYEYIDEIWRNLPGEKTPEGVAPIDAFVGPLVDVFFHEFGHVVFYMLQVPVFGREEDAADQFSAYLMLNFGYAEARRLIAGTAHQFRRDLKPRITLKLGDFSDTHGAPATRFYNLLCIAYGANPDLFSDFVSNRQLPIERAIGCHDEFRELAHAFKTLIRPHIDEALAKEVMARHWLPEGMTKPTPHPDTARR